ncbi:MAG: hypothetical protein HY518_04375 [Candidatus Aenigmarchaeota archaeon]|nr:hypothetical protein [Candidatus Aenigmarchaeota archaeon]
MNKEPYKISDAGGILGKYSMYIFSSSDRNFLHFLGTVSDDPESAVPKRYQAALRKIKAQAEYNAERNQDNSDPRYEINGEFMSVSELLGRIEPIVSGGDLCDSGIRFLSRVMMDLYLSNPMRTLSGRRVSRTEQILKGIEKKSATLRTEGAAKE